MITFIGINNFHIYFLSDIQMKHKQISFFLKKNQENSIKTILIHIVLIKSVIFYEIY